jgi:hypothetical protein
MFFCHDGRSPSLWIWQKPWDSGLFIDILLAKPLTSSLQNPWHHVGNTLGISSAKPLASLQQNP